MEEFDFESNRISIILSRFLEQIRSVKRENWFYLLIGLHLIPLWAFKFIPTQDGPTHLYNVNLMIQLLSSSDSIIHQYFQFNPLLNPNWVTHVFLYILNYLVPPLIAEKIYVSFIVILLPLSAKFALGKMGKDQEIWAFLIFPFIQNSFFHLGFYNFLFESEPLFFCNRILASD